MRDYERHAHALAARKIMKNWKRMNITTENGLWRITIQLLHKDGVLFRSGNIERMRQDTWKQHAAWSYGDRDDDLQFRGSKLPDYVKGIAIDLGVAMGRKWPFTGIDFIDPDYVLKE